MVPKPTPNSSSWRGHNTPASLQSAPSRRIPVPRQLKALPQPNGLPRADLTENASARSHSCPLRSIPVAKPAASSQPQPLTPLRIRARIPPLQASKTCSTVPKNSQASPPKNPSSSMDCLDAAADPDAIEARVLALEKLVREKEWQRQHDALQHDEVTARQVITTAQQIEWNSCFVEPNALFNVEAEERDLRSATYNFQRECWLEMQQLHDRQLSVIQQRHMVRELAVSRQQAALMEEESMVRRLLTANCWRELHGAMVTATTKQALVGRLALEALEFQALMDIARTKASIENSAAFFRMRQRQWSQIAGSVEEEETIRRRHAQELLWGMFIRLLRGALEVEEELHRSAKEDSVEGLLEAAVAPWVKSEERVHRRAIGQTEASAWTALCRLSAIGRIDAHAREAQRQHRQCIIVQTFARGFLAKQEVEEWRLSAQCQRREEHGVDLSEAQPRNTTSPASVSPICNFQPLLQPPRRPSTISPPPASSMPVKPKQPCSQRCDQSALCVDTPQTTPASSTPLLPSLSSAAPSQTPSRPSLPMALRTESAAPGAPSFNFDGIERRSWDYSSQSCSARQPELISDGLPPSSLFPMAEFRERPSSHSVDCSAPPSIQPSPPPPFAQDTPASIQPSLPLSVACGIPPSKQPSPPLSVAYDEPPSVQPSPVHAMVSPDHCHSSELSSKTDIDSPSDPSTPLAASGVTGMAVTPCRPVSSTPVMASPASSQVEGRSVPSKQSQAKKGPLGGLLQKFGLRS